MDGLTSDQNDAVAHGHGDYLVVYFECVMNLTQRFAVLCVIE